MAILTIHRATWRRGGEPLPRRQAQGPTCLLNELGFMCCLGFDAVAMGVDRELLLGVGEPSELVEPYELRVPHQYLESPRFGVHPREEDEDRDHYYETTLVREAIAINDDCDLTDAEREAKLRPILMQLGWEDVVFDGEYPSDTA
jgi:hypothetical protein